MAKLSQRPQSTGALYDGRYGTRAGRPFGDKSVKAVDNHMGTDIESVRELDRELIARGVRMRIERRDESLDPQWRNERQAAKDQRAALVIASSWGYRPGELPAGLTAAQVIAADRAMRAGSWDVVADAAADRSRNMIADQRATSEASDEVRALARRFRKLAATRGEAAAVRMIRSIVRAA